MTLRALAAVDISQWLSGLNELLYNERDMQMHLAEYLRRTGHYDDVDLEYYIPKVELGPGYVWDSELRLDIVVRCSDKYVPVELKYKTRTLRRTPERFGEILRTTVEITKKQGAQDLGRYDFWKDVRRLELVGQRFENVVGGVAVFLTNEPSYLTGPKPTSNNIRFAMTPGKHGPERSWQHPSALTKKYPAFTLNRSYEIKWTEYRIDDDLFNATIIET